MEPSVFIEFSAEGTTQREREVIEEKMNFWMEAIDALNAVCRDFSHYYFTADCSENLIKKGEEDDQAQDGEKQL